MNQRGSTDPAGRSGILEAVAPLAPKGDDVNAVRRGLLEPLVAAHPDDPELASRLAAVYEAQGQDERAVAMLEPLRAGWARPKVRESSASPTHAADASNRPWPCSALTRCPPRILPGRRGPP